MTYILISTSQCSLLWIKFSGHLKSSQFGAITNSFAMIYVNIAFGTHMYTDTFLLVFYIWVEFLGQKTYPCSFSVATVKWFSTGAVQFGLPPAMLFTVVYPHPHIVFFYIGDFAPCRMMFHCSFSL